MKYREHQENRDAWMRAAQAEEAAWKEIQWFNNERALQGDYRRCQDAESTDAARIVRDGLNGMPDWMRQSMPPERRT
jgi:hypothetical protein